MKLPDFMRRRRPKQTRPVDVTPPVIVGVAKVGNKLTVKTGTWK
jgi:hypothetical protein